MKNINTLIKDIYSVVSHKDGWFTEPLSQEFGRELGLKLLETAGPRNEVPRLRLSQMGPRCPRSLWYSIHSPELAEPLPAYAKIKYTYGHILESLVIAMAKAAGHEVTGEQDELEVDGIVGHRDCVIDGNVVDVKSAGRYGFQKFKDGSIANDDAFGYLDQLDGYILGSRYDPLVRNKSSGYLLAIDQQLGHLCLYEHTARPESIRERIRYYRDIVASPEPPECTCGTVPDGKSGNYKLDTRASYNAYKFACNPHLRTFRYKSGPVYLTKVVRKPDVPEVDKFGKIVYN